MVTMSASADALNMRMLTEQVQKYQTLDGSADGWTMIYAIVSVRCVCAH